MSSSPTQPIVSESIGAVIGNLVSEYVAPPEVETRHYRVTTGCGDGDADFEFQFGLVFSLIEQKCQCPNPNCQTPPMRIVKVAHAYVAQISGYHPHSKAILDEYLEGRVQEADNIVASTHSLKITQYCTVDEEEEGCVVIRLTVRPDAKPEFSLMSLRGQPSEQLISHLDNLCYSNIHVDFSIEEVTAPASQVGAPLSLSMTQPADQA